MAVEEQSLCSQVSVGRKKADNNSAPKDFQDIAKVRGWNKRTLQDEKAKSLEKRIPGAS